MNTHSLPAQLKRIIASEKTDFIVKSSKQQSIKKTIPALIFAFAFMGVLSFIIFKVISPILEKELLDTTNITSINNWKHLMIPAICLGILAVVGIGLLIKTIRLFFDKGSYFVGTEQHLIQYRKGKATFKKWNEFSDKATIKQKHNYGDLTLYLKTKKTDTIIVDEDIYNDTVDEEFYTETITMIGIRNVMNIESKCKYRISKSI